MRGVSLFDCLLTFAFGAASAITSQVDLAVRVTLFLIWSTLLRSIKAHMLPKHTSSNLIAVSLVLVCRSGSGLSVARCETVK